MKIDEITAENQKLDEANPYGLMQRAGSAIMGKLGSTSAQASGDVGKRSNELYNGFKNWALRSGVDMKAVPKLTLTKWLASQRLPTKLPPTLAPLPLLNLEDPNVSKTLWTALAQGAYGAARQPASSPTLGANYGIPPAAPRRPTPPVPPTPPAPPVPPAPADLLTDIQAKISQLKRADRTAYNNLLSSLMP
jgi:hypothetical protein